MNTKDLVLFIQKATPDQLTQIETTLNQQEEKSDLTLEEVLNIIKNGLVDFNVIKYSIDNKNSLARSEQAKATKIEEEKKKQERLVQFKNSEKFQTFLAKVNDLKEEYELLNGKELTVSFTVPIKAIVNVSLYNFDSIFTVCEDALYELVDFTLELGDNNLTNKQISAIREAMKDLVSGYNCELVDGLFDNSELAGFCDKVEKVKKEFKKLGVDYDLEELING